MPRSFVPPVIPPPTSAPSIGDHERQRSRGSGPERKRYAITPAGVTDLQLDYELFHIEAALRSIEHAERRLRDVAAQAR